MDRVGLASDRVIPEHKRAVRRTGSCRCFERSLDRRAFVGIADCRCI